VQNSVISINEYSITNFWAPDHWSGRFEYSSNGGNQTFNFHVNQGAVYILYIDGVAKEKGDGWNISNGELLTVASAKNNATIIFALVPRPRPLTNSWENIFWVLLVALVIVALVIIALARQVMRKNRIRDNTL